MTVLPPVLLRAPRLFYAAAVFFFIASFGLSYLQIQQTMDTGGTHDAWVRMALLQALFQAALHAFYVAALGVIVQLLLAIWQDAAVRRDRGGDS
jgi:hypothetical protein